MARRRGRGRGGAWLGRARRPARSRRARPAMMHGRGLLDAHAAHRPAPHGRPTACARPAPTTSSPSPRPFGTFEAEGTSQVAVRMQEIAALAALQDLSKAGVFARSAGESLVKVGAGVVDAVTDPVATAKGIGGGVKRFGVNLGRRTKRAVQKHDHRRSAEARTGRRVVGRRRRWRPAPPRACSASTAPAGAGRERVGADPYTRNPVLRDALEQVAQGRRGRRHRRQVRRADSAARRHHRRRRRPGVGPRPRRAAQAERGARARDRRQRRRRQGVLPQPRVHAHDADAASSPPCAPVQRARLRRLPGVGRGSRRPRAKRCSSWRAPRCCRRSMRRRRWRRC